MVHGSSCCLTVLGRSHKAYDIFDQVFPREMMTRMTGPSHADLLPNWPQGSNKIAEYESDKNCMVPGP